MWSNNTARDMRISWIAYETFSTGTPFEYLRRISKKQEKNKKKAFFESTHSLIFLITLPFPLYILWPCSLFGFFCSFYNFLFTEYPQRNGVSLKFTYQIKVPFWNFHSKLLFVIHKMQLLKCTFLVHYISQFLFLFRIRKKIIHYSNSHLFDNWILLQ